VASRTSHSTIAPAGYLLLGTVPAALALPTVSVLGIVPAAEWNAEAPLPLSALVPIHFAASEPEWVLRIEGGAQSIIALISGAVRVAYLPTEAVLMMPALNVCGFDIFSNVVLTDGKPSALVVNIDALFRRHRELGN
jgi:hypothetical protein